MSSLRMENRRESDSSSASSPLSIQEIRHTGVIQSLGITTSHAVLDLGCGEGHHIRAVSLRSPRLLVAADIKLQNLTIHTDAIHGGARHATNGVSFVCADALRLPFASETFDRVICSLVLYLLPIDTALRELHRILKLDGRVYIRVPMLAWGRVANVARDAQNLRSFVYAACHVFNGLIYTVTGSQVSNPLVRHDRWALYVPRRRFVEAVRRSGFDLERIEFRYPKPKTPSIEAWLRKNR